MSARAEALERMHAEEKVRLTDWGAPHVVPEDNWRGPVGRTECGRRFLEDEAREPREDNPGACVQCRDAYLGKERVHVPTVEETPGPRRDRVQRAKRRARRRRERIYGSPDGPDRVDDDARSERMNPGDNRADRGKTGGFLSGVKRLARRLFGSGCDR